VAEQPTNSFTEYLKGAKPNQPIGVSFTGGPGQVTSSGGSGGTNRGWLATAFDALNTGVYGQTRIANKLLDLPEQVDQGDALGALSSAGSALSEAFWPFAIGKSLGNTVKRAFGAEVPEEEAQTFEAVVEKSYDVLNRNNPNYVDFANNVSPIAKGTVGLTLDIGLDPLTYLTFGAAGGAKIAARGGKAAVDAVSGKAIESTAQATSPAGRAATDAIVSAERTPGVRNIPSTQTTAPALKLTDDAGEATRIAKAPENATLEGLQAYGARFSEYMDNLQGTAARITVRDGFSAMPVPKAAQSAFGGIDNIPSAQLADEVAEATVRAGQSGAKATDEILKTVRETINKKTINLPGQSGRTNLRGGLAGLFKTLAKPSVQAGKAAPAANVLTPGGYGKKLRADLASPKMANMRLGDLLPGINTGNIPGNVNARISPTVGKALAQYDKLPKESPLRQAIVDRVLKPLQDKYNAAAQAGKSVNSLGLPTTAKAAADQAMDESAAAIIATNLKNLDTASKERATALLGEDFFQLISNMPPKELAPFLDDIDVILRKSGVIDDVSLLTKTTAVTQFVRIFDVDATMLQAARTDVAEKFAKVDGVTPETLEQNIRNISQLPGVQDDTLAYLTANGFDVSRYSTAEVEQLGKALEEVFDSGVKPALLTTFDDAFRTKNGYTTFTDTGVPRTADEFAEGKGVIPNVVNTHAQMNIWINIGKTTNKFFEGGGKTLDIFKGLNGTQRAAAKERLDLALMKTVEDFLDKRGVPITMDWRAIKNGSEAVRSLRFSTAFTTIQSSIKSLGYSDEWMRLLFSNADTGVASSKFMDSIMTAITGGNIDDVTKILTSSERRNLLRVADDDVAGIAKSPNKIANWLAEPGAWGRYGTFNKAQARSFKNTDLIKKGPKTPKGGTQRLFNKEAATRILAEAIIRSADDLDKLSSVAGKTLAQRGVAEGEAVSESVAKIISEILYDPKRYVDQMRVVAYSGRMVKDVANTVENISPLGASLANTKVSLALGKNVKNSALTTIKLSEAVASGNPKAIAKATDDYYKQVDEIVRDIDAETFKTLNNILTGRTTVTDPAALRMLDNQMAEVIDHGNDAMRAVTTGGFTAIRASILKNFDVLDQWFNARRGMKAEDQLFVSQLYRGVESLQGHLQSKYLLPINQIGKQYNGWVDDSTTVLQQGYNNIRTGVPGTGIVGQAQEAMAPYFARLFGGSSDPANALLGNIFLRTGAQLERVNQILAQKRVLETTAEGLARAPEEYFDLGLAVEKAGPNATQEDIMNAVADQWRTWDVQDPIQFLDRMYKAAVQVSAEAGYVGKFTQEAISLGVASREPVEGFVKISSSSEGVLTKHLVDDIYVDPQVREAFKAVDEVVEGNTGLFSIPFGGKLDEFTDATKYAMTQARLGHHVRNYAGGLTMTHMAMGAKHYGKAHRDALRTLSTIRNNDEYDLVAAMTAMDIPLRSTKRNAGKAAEVLYTSPKTKKSVTTEEVVEAATRLGIFPKVRTAEAFATTGEAQGRVGRWTQKFLTFSSLGLAARGGKMEKMWSTISEGQDHANRLQMFLQYTYQALDGTSMVRGVGKAVRPKELEDVFSFAAERVLKYHPTSAVLTRFEKAVPRRLFPFYAWNKGAVMALTEAVIMHPARVNLPGKISYNIGVASGVDPNSMYDPFPKDQQFPSWLTEDVQGPQFLVNGKYYGAAPGIAQWDIVNQFGGSDNAFDPIRQAFVDALNPAFKLPIEGLFESRLSTKGPITDISDYVDQSIPNLSYFANLSGYSPSSIFVEGEFQQQAKVESGVKGFLDKFLAAANWATGFGISNTGRADYIRSAETERQLRLAEEKERGQQ